MPRDGKVMSIIGYLIATHLGKLSGAAAVLGLIVLAIITILTVEFTMVVNLKTKKIEKFVIHKRGSKIDAKIGKEK